MRRHRLSFSIAAVVAFFGARSFLFATPSQPPAATVLPDQIDLARLVDLCSQRLQISIEYDPAALKGAAATLRLGSPVSDAELWSLTNRLLASHGFTTVRAPTSAPNSATTPNPGDNPPAPGELATYSVVKSSEAAAAARIEEGPDGSLFAAGFKTVVVRTVHRSAKDLAEALKPFLTKSGAGQVGSASIVEVSPGPAATGPAALAGLASTPSAGPGGLLVISDLSARLDQALRMLEMLDSPAEKVVIQEVLLQHAPGTQIATLATQLTAKQGALSGRRVPGEVVASTSGAAVLIVAPESQVDSWRGLVAQLDQREPTEAVNYTPKYFSAKEVAKLVEQTVRDTGTGDDRFKVVVDDLTGTLIVTATPAQQERIRALVERLDNVPPAARRPMRTFAVRNRPVKEIVEVVQKMLDLGVLEAEPIGTSKEAGAAGTTPSDPAKDAIVAGVSAASLPPDAPAIPHRLACSRACSPRWRRGRLDARAAVRKPQDRQRLVGALRRRGDQHDHRRGRAPFSRAA